LEKVFGQMIESQLRGVQFFLRERFWGRVSLRRSLPRVENASTDTPNQTGEHRFYELLIRGSFNESECRSFDKIIDVGCRNGSYLPALRRLFPQAQVLGIELDGLRRYWNFYRRADYARAYAQACDASVLFGDFRKLSDPSLGLPSQGKVLITIFYPFVSERPCLKWGLPVEFSHFSELLAEIKKLSAKNPNLTFEILSAHQGEWEAEKARTLLPQATETIHAPEEFASLWPALHPVHTFRSVRIS
jgi:hypothetical protein